MSHGGCLRIYPSDSEGTGRSAVRACVGMYVCLCVRLSLRVRVCLSADRRILYEGPSGLYVGVACACVCMFMCTCACTCVCARVHVCVSVPVSVSLRVQAMPLGINYNISDLDPQVRSLPFISHGQRNLHTNPRARDRILGK